MVPWRFRVIADKLAKMIGGRGADDGDDDFSLPFDHPIDCRSNSVDVPHMRQRFDWDCGLACVLMVLRTVGLEQFDIRDLEKICDTTSIWTVDLAYLLHKFSVKFSFLTVTLGANPEYSAESYYREQLQDDIERVNGLFEKALEAGINIQCRSISAKDISLLILTGQCVAVALVNKIKLSQYWTKDAQDADCYMSNSDYMGHYVVICGFDRGSGEFEIRDPASPRKHEKLSIECLDEARKSFGTDEDILLISLSGKKFTNLSSRLVK
ncbi:guanylyl cyclase 1-like isoform X1 [Zingiber officinale]|uniref:guanylyl cyclase 1-like isoform X1 n=1 Tax=Zingiber officinale TaxID=94328 RepID=UPI001C4B454A|nr:guanylyl cyclase 1-like isoform X1 [Zingiber officinale]